MEFYKKIKQKIEDELNQEEDEEDEEEEEPPNADMEEGERSDEYRNSHTENKLLRKEVSTLKEHINRNYDVYVKRLEKRKAKIKELEDNTRIILNENENLATKVKECEGYGQQLTECRDSLEQLEGYQNQELAKVKHMLLNAETSLELEKQERLKIRDQLEDLQKERDLKNEHLSEVYKSRDATTNTLQISYDINNGVEESEETASDDHGAEIDQLRDEHEKVINELKGTISVLKAEIQNVNDPNNRESSQVQVEVISSEGQEECKGEKSAMIQQSNELKEALESTKLKYAKNIKDLEQHNTDLKTKLQSMRNERDTAKSSLLEIEIAKHECEEGLSKQDSESKLKMVQVTTEKETLEMTLGLREQELKTRKEELRQEQEKLGLELRDLEELANTRALQNSVLQAELDGTKRQLAESNQCLGSAEASNQTFQQDIERLNADLTNQHSIVSVLQDTLDKTNTKYEELNNDFESLVSMNDKLEKDNSDLKSSVSLLEERCELASNSNEELTIKCDKLTNEVSRLQEEISELDRTFPERLESSERVQSLKDKLIVLEDEVSEKKQSAKLLQQRLNDMKKMFQKELKTTPGKVADAQQNGDDSYLCYNDSDNLNSISSHSHDRKVPLDFVGASPSTPPYTLSKTISPGINYSPMEVACGDISATLSKVVDLEYLKHVIFKFLTSKEYEAKQLTRAIATLLRFTQDEERLLIEHLDWKASWFGSKPDLGKGQFSRSIDHTP